MQQNPKHVSFHTLLWGLFLNHRFLPSNVNNVISLTLLFRKKYMRTYNLFSGIWHHSVFQLNIRWEPHKKHRLTLAGRHLQRLPKPASAQAGAGTAGCPGDHPAGFEWVESISRKGSYTSSLGNVCHCLVTLTLEKVFSRVQVRMFCVSVCTGCLLNCHWAPPKRAWLLLF